jgi:FKBP-type peptidyl-prolyl cis-trans isomerase
MKNMKTSIVLIAVLLTAGSLRAQNPADSTLLKNHSDSISYVLGEICAFYLTQQGFGDIPVNQAAFAKGATDVLGKKGTLIDDVTANTMLNNYMMNIQAQKAKKHIDAGTVFLAENKKKPGVITTESGLQYEIIKQGTGIKPAAIDTFVAHYRGTLLDGTEFDASYNRGQPLTMEANRVIKGWTEGLQLMPVGSKYRFWIPYNLAYGMMDQGAIPGGSTLVFEVELLEVKKKK